MYIRCSSNLLCRQFYYSKIIKYRSENERKCKMCTTDDIGDEYHYFFTCDSFKSDRKLYLKPYVNVKPNIRKYRELFTSTNEATLIKLSFFCNYYGKFSVYIVFPND